MIPAAALQSFKVSTAIRFCTGKRFQPPFAVFRDAMERWFCAGDRGDGMAVPIHAWAETNYRPGPAAKGSLSGLTSQTGNREGALFLAFGTGGILVPDALRVSPRIHSTNNGDDGRIITDLIRGIVRLSGGVNADGV